VNYTTETPVGPFPPSCLAFPVHFLATPNSSSSSSSSVSEPLPNAFFNFFASSLAFSAFFSVSSVFYARESASFYNSMAFSFAYSNFA